MKKIALLFILMLLAACTTPPPTAELTPTSFLSTATPSSDLKLPSRKSLPPSPPSPTVDPSITTRSSTSTATSTATSAATRTAIGTPAFTATSTEPIPPSPSPNAELTCASIAAQGQEGLYVLYVRPSEKLVWDMTPRQFMVGLCNSLSVPLVPASHFIVSIRIPFRKDGGGQTSALVAQLSPGFTEITLGSWTPGLESHVTICVQKPAIEVIVGYSDLERSSIFRPVSFPDGNDRLVLPVECGGNYA